MWTPQKLYRVVVNLDKYVRRRRLIPLSRYFKPSGGPVAHLPAEYTRWANQQDESTLDRFWWHIVNGEWRRAKKLSGLKRETIAELMYAASEADTKVHGNHGPDPFAIYGIPVSRFVQLLKSSEHGGVFEEYANAGASAPPWGKLSKKEKVAFAEMADLLNREAK